MLLFAVVATSAFTGGRHGDTINVGSCQVGVRGSEG
jgi:hypothetical protein